MAQLKPVGKIPTGPHSAPDRPSPGVPGAFPQRPRRAPEGFPEGSRRLPAGFPEDWKLRKQQFKTTYAFLMIWGRR